MESLKALLERKRKATDEAFAGRKYVKRSQLEDQRLQQLRLEEERDAQAKVVLARPLLPPSVRPVSPSDLPCPVLMRRPCAAS